MVDRLSNELVGEKKRLGESKDHVELENNLNTANEKVDELERHYR